MNSLSSILFTRPIGEWVAESDGYADGLPVYDMWYCSICDYAVENDEMPTWNFCPHCGAYNRVFDCVLKSDFGKRKK